MVQLQGQGTAQNPAADASLMASYCHSHREETRDHCNSPCRHLNQCKHLHTKWKIAISTSEQHFTFRALFHHRECIQINRVPIFSDSVFNRNRCYGYRVKWNRHQVKLLHRANQQRPSNLDLHLSEFIKGLKSSAMLCSYNNNIGLKLYWAVYVKKSKVWMIEFSMHKQEIWRIFVSNCSIRKQQIIQQRRRQIAHWMHFRL